MEPIGNHTLYIRLQKVIDSCETPEQHQVAAKYAELVCKRIIYESVDGWIEEIVHEKLQEDGWNLTK